MSCHGDQVYLLVLDVFEDLFGRFSEWGLGLERNALLFDTILYLVQVPAALLPPSSNLAIGVFLPLDGSGRWVSVWNEMVTDRVENVGRRADTQQDELPAAQACKVNGVRKYRL